MSARAVFLDKDGTLVENVAYNVDPDRVRLTRGAPEALRRLHEAGYLLVVVSNQSGVARGYFPESALHEVEARLKAMLEEVDAPLGGFYYCPHLETGVVSQYAVKCACRKPLPGMLLAAARTHGIDLARSWLVGDILDDIEAGRRAGCRAILLRPGGETEWRLSPLRMPHFYAADLREAAEIIMGRGGELLVSRDAIETLPPGRGRRAERRRGTSDEGEFGARKT